MQEAAKHLEKAEEHLTSAHTEMAAAFAALNNDKLSSVVAIRNLLQAGGDIAKLYAEITGIRALTEYRE
jgi:hypothetical protein